jgi:hypothetical protein
VRSNLIPTNLSTAFGGSNCASEYFGVGSPV